MKRVLCYWFLLLSHMLQCRTILSSDSARQVIVVAGNFSIDGKPVNIAQYDSVSGLWSNKYQSELYLYGESNGAIYDLVVNESSTPYNKLFVAGMFDTVTRISQIQLCSFASWDGGTFNKVGEGLCPRGVDTSAKIRVNSVAMTSEGNLFVGGNFESRVWDGHKYVTLYHIALFDATIMAWLPLEGGQLHCSDKAAPSVNALVWDAAHSVMIIGGQFDLLDNEPITSNIAVWTRSRGIMAFQGGGVHFAGSGSGSAAMVQTLAFEPVTESLFVGGKFDRVNGLECTTIAVWNRRSKQWRCLYQPSRAIGDITTMLLHENMLFLAGWAHQASNWTGWQFDAPYAIARLDVGGYLNEQYVIAQQIPKQGNHNNSDKSDDKDNNSSSSGGGNKNDEHGQHSAKDDADTKKRAGESHSDDAHYYGDDEEEDRYYDEPASVDVKSARAVDDIRHSHLLFTDERIDTESAARRRRLNTHETTRRLRGSNNSNNTSTSIKQYKKPNRLLGSATRDKSRTGRPSYLLSAASHAPTLEPTLFRPRKWDVDWSWLPGFIGGNGPILRLMYGRGAFQDSLFISGAFNNYPAVMMWQRYRNTNEGNISAVGGARQIAGTVTSITQAILPFEPVSPVPIIRVSDRYDYTIFILLACVISGVIMGLGVAIAFLKSGYTAVPTTDTDAEEDEAPHPMGMSLMTLSSGNNNMVDFRQCFERAMRARHLPTNETLQMINPKEIVLSNIIGEGSFGRVWSAEWRNNAVAVKEFVFAQAAIVGGSSERSNLIEEIVGEAGVMACLRHPKILQLYGCTLTMQAIWIVSELCIRGSLRMVLNNKAVHLPLIKKLSIAMDVADGMLYLHTRNTPVIHRDLKSHNIFITEPSRGHFVAKIGDWGSARAIAMTGGRSMTHGVGTACWLSPEVINNAHFSMSSDVYAYGIVLWEIFTRQEMYEGLSAAQIIAKVAHEGLRPNIPLNCPWERMMTDCWKSNPDERPTFRSILLGLNRIYTVARARVLRSRLQQSIQDSKNIRKDANNSTGDDGHSDETGNVDTQERRPLLVDLSDTNDAAHPERFHALLAAGGIDDQDLQDAMGIGPPNHANFAPKWTEGAPAEVIRGLGSGNMDLRLKVTDIREYYPRASIDFNSADNYDSNTMVGIRLRKRSISGDSYFVDDDELDGNAKDGQHGDHKDSGSLKGLPGQVDYDNKDSDSDTAKAVSELLQPTNTSARELLLKKPLSGASYSDNYYGKRSSMHDDGGIQPNSISPSDTFAITPIVIDTVTATAFTARVDNTNSSAKSVASDQQSPSSMAYCKLLERYSQSDKGTYDTT